MRKAAIFTLILAFVLISLPRYASDHKGLLVVESNENEQTDYDKLWKWVRQMELEGRPESAIEALNKIYEAAKKENNGPQIVKFLIHYVKFSDQKEENAFIDGLEMMRKEAEASEPPLKNVIYSAIAEMHWWYYEAHRYNIMNRTPVVGNKSPDIETWDLKTIGNEIHKYYELSLRDKEILKKTKTEAYQQIITTGKNTENERPTLFDFLGHRAIDFYTNGEAGLTQSVNYFKLDQAVYLGDAKQFLDFTIPSPKVSLSFHYNALVLMQELIDFHHEQDIAAFIDIDLKRLIFASKHLTLQHKQELLERSLKGLVTKYSDHPSSAMAAYELANIYDEQANKYIPLQGEKYRWQRKQAMELCNTQIEKFPKSYGALRCMDLVYRITDPFLEARINNVQLPNEPFLSLISVKNVKEVQIKIVKLTENRTFMDSRRKSEDILRQYQNLPAVKEWTQQLQDDKDYQRHSTEISIPALGKGRYGILFTDISNKKRGLIFSSDFIVSNLSYVYRNEYSGACKVYVFDRKSGKPLPKVKVEAYKASYDYASRKNKFSLLNETFTDNDGAASFSALNTYSEGFHLYFTKGDDALSTRRSLYAFNRSNRMPNAARTTHFFTDRAIYRPGQTVYFKGIVMEKNQNDHRIVPGEEVTVEFLDVNYQQVKSVKLTTNEFGTFHGEFVTPTGSLNGLMHIRTASGNTRFRVEEYKRPKFEVSFSPVNGSFKLDEKIKVQGNAQAFSGANLGGATVNYRIVRNANYPYFGYGLRAYYPTAVSLEIAQGETVTNDDGLFNIEFDAKGDPTLPKDYNPVYSFTIYADVTDLNGETQSGIKTVSVGKKSLLISTNIESEIDGNQLPTANVYSTNLNGQFIETKVAIKFWQLKDKSRLLLKRKWAEPDRHDIAKKEFIEQFPHQPYSNEAAIENWSKLEVIYDTVITTNDSSMLDLKQIKALKLGAYAIELSAKDEFGENVEWEKRFIVYDKNSNEAPVYQFNWFKALDNSAEPGSTVSFLVGTGAKDVTVLYEIEHQHQIISKSWVKLNANQKQISIPVKEEYRGNFTIHTTFIKEGAFFSNSHVYRVPYSNKVMDVSFATFRDKLLPGEQETWKIKITGPKGDAAAAELMTTMYDASLDDFAPNYWQLSPYQELFQNNPLVESESFTLAPVRRLSKYLPYKGNTPNRYYNKLNWFNYRYYPQRVLYETVAVSAEKTNRKSKRESKNMPQSLIETDEMADASVAGNDFAAPAPTPPPIKKMNQKDETPVKKDRSSLKVRSNFNETAFFYPQLRTDKEGNVEINFTVPESLTRWKILGLAHSKDLKIGQFTKELITQKKLMLVTNPPRFFREGDQLELKSKVTNLSQEKIDGTARIQLFDALNGKEVTSSLLTSSSSKTDAHIEPGKSSEVSWNIKVPEGIRAITYRVVIESGKFSDGEEYLIPVLTNRMLVTESVPLSVKGSETKKFQLKNLLSNQSTTLRHERVSLEFSSNPAWYAVQALPYLMEYPYDCSEQIFSRFYANSIGAHIANSSPKVKAVFDQWKALDPQALISNLEKNQELKALMLEETPWVMQAQDETERKRRVGLLFDLNKMSSELDGALKKLQELQAPNGGWPWFKGMEDNRYITQHIITGMGHLKNLGIISVIEDPNTVLTINKAIDYLDRRVIEDYKRLKRSGANMSQNHLGYSHIQYLYARTYFSLVPFPQGNKAAFNYYKDQAKTYWLSQNLYMQAMIALVLNRQQDEETAKAILISLKEKSIVDEEMGMYWKEPRGYYWYQAPIERQAMMIEAFDEINKDITSVEEMKIWLLKQKQTQDWKTTRATTEACYALLMRGSDLLEVTHDVEIKLGKHTVKTNDPSLKKEAGTGYFKTTWSASAVSNEMGDITVKRTALNQKNEQLGVAWGGVYWQYFEQLDKIKTQKTPLSIVKQLYVVKNSESGPVLVPITDKTPIKLGDKIKVRVELRVDRDMSYVHMKDMRASGFEPINTNSGYRYQDGLGYYESTKDASTNFFFDYLKKGTYVFEYPLRANITGNFSNGITSIQSMYAPEFTSHSEGIRVTIEQ